MSIESRTDLEGLQAAGRVVRAALQAMERHVCPGVTTMELNDIGAEVLARNGARSAPMMVYGFPAEVLISVNDEIVHGIPSGRVIRAGDLVKLDVTVEKDGYMADAAITVAVAPVPDDRQALVDCARRAFYKALQVTRAGNRVNQIGRAVEHEVFRSGFAVVQGLAGHGIGRVIHEEPEVPNWYDARARTRLTDGLVITIEPMVTTGSGEAFEDEDGWTIRTTDGALAAHYEQTLVVMKGRPMLLTA